MYFIQYKWQREGRMKPDWKVDKEICWSLFFEITYTCIYIHTSKILYKDTGQLNIDILNNFKNIMQILLNVFVLVISQ